MTYNNEKSQYYNGSYHKEKKYLMKDLVDSIDKDNFSQKIEMDYLTKQINPFVNNVKNSALRKVYESYLDISEYEDNKYEIEKQIWIARLAYQEKRRSQGKTILPEGFTLALKKIENKIGKELFKKFMEVLVAYHKYLGGKE